MTLKFAAISTLVVSFDSAMSREVLVAQNKGNTLA